MIYFFIFLPIVGIALGIAIRFRERSKNKPIIEQNSTIAHFQPAAGPKLEPRRKADLSPTSVGSSPYSVLIVDDQSAIRMLMRELFELEQVTVYEAPHGKAAIEMVQHHPIDFILLDLKMPDMDGIEALREIRKVDTEVMVVMITAYGDPDKLEAARQLGVQAFFTKPFDIDHVKNHVMGILNKQETREGEVS
ncbi:response regulator [Paenibacillus solisilvae]|uniref:Response regulator n=1 Tax=Paenibacillus solisilvae TaxID=2486751 RepID=A0ABW0VSP4_9BACL